MAAKPKKNATARGPEAPAAATAAPRPTTTRSVHPSARTRAMRAPRAETKARGATALDSATKKTIASALVRQDLRTHVEHEAQRLKHVRSAHHVAAEVLAERGDNPTVRPHVKALTGSDEARWVQDIQNRLERQEALPWPRGLESLEGVGPRSTPSAQLGATPATQATQAAALIEKIERFVRSQRPGLTVTLNNSLGARAEIERVGPQEISLRLIGHAGPPTAQAVSRIREEVRKRGLKLASLSVA